MKKTVQNFIGGILLLILATAFTDVAKAQVTYTESFDAATAWPPAGWSAVGSNSRWSRQATGTLPNCTPHSGAGMARYNRTGAPGSSPQTFASPMIDYSNRGVDTPRVSLWIFRDNGAPTINDIITVFVNTTPDLIGASNLGSVARSRVIQLPDTQATNGWYLYSFDIPSGFASSTNYLLIRGSSDVTPGNNIFIDDIQWDAFPTPCSGSPNPGIISSTDTVLCGGGGTATLTLHGQSTESGITIQWKSGPSSSGPWTDFGTSTPSVSTGNLTTTMYFYCVLTCSNSSTSDSTTVREIIVDANPAPVISVTVSNNGNYCAGVPDTLVATGTLFYSWSPATGLDTTGGSTVLASPPGVPGASVMYTATGTNASGCTGRDSVLVTVHSTTTVTIQTTPNDTICTGQQVNLNAIEGAGPFVTDYLWSTGETSQNITSLPTVNTTYTVYGTNNWGCVGTDSVHITIVPGTIPSITSINATNNGLYCVGGPAVTLTVTGTGGTIYEWSPATGLNTTSGDSVVSTPPGGGPGGGTILYTVTLTSPSGCSDFDTIYVRRANRPNINFTVTSDSVCIGDSTTLNAQGFGFNYTYSWLPGGETTQAITVAPSSNTLYSVHVVSGTSGCTRDTAALINVFPGPNAWFGYNITGRTVTFHDSSTNATGYEWIFGDGNISFQHNPVYTYSANGTYTVRLIATNGSCTADTAIRTFTVTLVGIEELSNNGVIFVSPNPVQNMATVEFRSEGNVSLQVVNTLGEVISERKINSIGNSIHKEEIDMSGLPSGVYMIHLNSAGKTISRKLIKQ